MKHLHDLFLFTHVELIQSCVSFWGRESAFPSEKWGGRVVQVTSGVVWSLCYAQTGDCQAHSCGIWPRLGRPAPRGVRCQWPRLGRTSLSSSTCVGARSPLQLVAFVNILAHSFVPPILRLNTQHPRLVFHRPLSPAFVLPTQPERKKHRRVQRCQGQQELHSASQPLPAQLTGPGQVT